MEKINLAIANLRKNAHMSQTTFATLFGVSRQTVQKWENGSATPELPKLIDMSRYFHMSLDQLVLDKSTCMMADRTYGQGVKPNYSISDAWETYADRQQLLIEYRQSIAEGLNITAYEKLFRTVAELPSDETKDRLADILYDLVSHAETVEGYPYREPSDLDGIRALRRPHPVAGTVDMSRLPDRIAGAWMGRVAGCMLGKTVEGIRTRELIPLLRETDNYPLHRYIRRADMREELYNKYTFPLRERIYADEITCAPADDDTNYTVMAQELIRRFGRDFTPGHVSRLWLSSQVKDAYCTAERVAYRNFLNRYEPPYSAMYKNPFREWIGAQIRADYYGYINPGNPSAAAEMAWRDACISHVKNGIYGAMYVAAMLAVAAVTDDMAEIVAGGLAEIPSTSRLYEAVSGMLDGYRNGVGEQACFAWLRETFSEEDDWCGTVSNACIVTASLLYGKGDFTRSVCMAVQSGFDTDCNGATVGSVLGMANGQSGIPGAWLEPFGNKLETGLFGLQTVDIKQRIDMTLSHMAGV